MISKKEKTVFKLGGSLLLQADWPSRLRIWLENQPSGDYYGIVGGGELIEALRHLDRIYPGQLSPFEMHWRCIRALDATFEIACELTPEFEKRSSSDFLNAIAIEKVSDQRCVAWVRIGAFCSEADQMNGHEEQRPSIGWQTTSDSLALFLASTIGARRCVIFKSCPTNDIRSLEDAVDRQIVDSECLRFRNLVPSIELIELASERSLNS